MRLVHFEAVSTRAWGGTAALLRTESLDNLSEILTQEGIEPRQIINIDTTIMTKEYEMRSEEWCVARAYCWV